MNKKNEEMAAQEKVIIEDEALNNSIQPTSIGKIVIGDFTITDAYSESPKRVGIYRTSGEGGDFNKADLEKIIGRFYNKYF